MPPCPPRCRCRPASSPCPSRSRSSTSCRSRRQVPLARAAPGFPRPGRRMGGESSSEENLKIAYAFAACGGFAMTMEHNDPDRVVPETLDDRSDPTATDLPPLDELLGGDAGPAAST